MKKTFALVAFITLILTLYKMVWTEKDNGFNSEKFEAYSQVKPVPDFISPQEKTIPKPTRDLKAKKIKKVIRKKPPKSIRPQENQNVNGDEKHSAQTDPQGKIYPRSVKIDEDMIIAYGDLIVGSTEDLEDYQSGDKMLNIPPPQLWPAGDVPYEIDDSIDDPIQINTIKHVTDQLNQMAGVHFHPRKEDEDNYVLFKKGTQHCYANVGFRLGVTNVSLSAGCAEKEIFHELFHVLGFFHEQNRPDRDNYIEVLWENIDEENWTQFERFSIESYPSPFQDFNNNSFSFNSIMLYNSNTFSESSDYSMVKLDGTPFIQKFLIPTLIDQNRLKILYP